MEKISLPTVIPHTEAPLRSQQIGNGLTDSYGRSHTSLRLSLTDKCNLRCIYCMDENTDFLPFDSLLSNKEIFLLVRFFVSLGIRKIRLTGGEPLLRKGLPDLIALLRTIPNLDEIALTTNGLLLDKLAMPLFVAGLNRITISLDTLNESTFEKMSRRKGLRQVLDGIASTSAAGFKNISINTVLVRDINDKELISLVDFSHQNGLLPRFIESMPIGAGKYDRQKLVESSEIIQILKNTYREMTEIERPNKHSPAKFYRIPKGKVGIIASVSHPFCSVCNRLRVTAEGKFRTCLFSHIETDLLPFIRPEIDQKEMEKAISRSVWGKLAGHGANDIGFIKPNRTMHSIGG